MYKYHIQLHPDNIYHIYNQVNGTELLFRSDENYRFFLSRYTLHANSICDTFSYNLLPDHFHLIVKIKPEIECIRLFEKTKKIEFDASKHDISQFIMERFSNWCNSYTKAYNKMYNRKGALFIDFMKRYEIINHSELLRIINFIHFNAGYHERSKKPLDWKWSSYKAFTSNKKTSVQIEKVLEIFGGIDAFNLSHDKMVKPEPHFEFL